jgi:hypothetical protein
MMLIDMIRQSPGGGQYWMEDQIQQMEMAAIVRAVGQNVIYCNWNHYCSTAGWLQG